ncbi:hypothetical protein [Candidatus Viridilinea mediisalina]|uniref:Uncharacterized protein n=1 Tax=Candidatus Viridilinea mediisalina TaxID=2024553 RepID=A0A2A6RK82_9CHLR|nr:hypothetical protein [Candidatus Viridilinea mediisalina]PDW03514.1 hypothetical protein CJ255_08510 [Candidatus Viridilinea mediisalina]
MLHILPPHSLASSSAAVARARLHVALRVDRSHVAAASPRSGGRVSAGEAGEALLRRLLSEKMRDEG